MELAAHKRLTADTGVNVFFAAPRSPWQRGTCRRSARTTLTPSLSNRPRKCLGFRIPAESVALTA